MKTNAAAQGTVLDARVSAELAKAQAMIDVLKEDARREATKAQQVAQIREIKSQLDRLISSMKSAGTLPQQSAEDVQNARIYAAQKKLAKFDLEQKRNADPHKIWHIDARRQRKALVAELNSALGVDTLWAHMVP